MFTLHWNHLIVNIIIIVPSSITYFPTASSAFLLHATSSFRIRM